MYLHLKTSNQWVTGYNSGIYYDGSSYKNIKIVYPISFTTPRVGLSFITNNFASIIELTYESISSCHVVAMDFNGDDYYYKLIANNNAGFWGILIGY